MAAPETVGSFRVKRELGRGGMGIVYLADDTKLNREVAIKALSQKVLEQDGARARLQREAQILASLNHPNIAAIYQLEEDASTVYLILEYVPGESLGARIERGPIALKEALPIAHQIAEAMAASHQKEVVHRDLKPNNVLINPEGRVKVLDFVLAKPVGDAADLAVTQPGMIVGTPYYMSPEQARGEATDHRPDIWAFGCILYEMLSGRRVFLSESLNEVLSLIFSQEPDWNLLPTETPELVRKLLKGCLTKDPTKRIGSFRDVVALLVSPDVSTSSVLYSAFEPPPIPHNLPRRLTTFVGRQQEMDEIKSKLSHTALLTLTGSGGCGKTRLALELARSVLGDYKDGVWFVDLSPLADPALVPQAVLGALGLKEETGKSPTETLLDHLTPTTCLLIMDNCEHVLEVCAQLAETLLSRCRGLRILASSREALSVAGEVPFRVPSLPVPGTRNVTGASGIEDCEAVRLFVERAKVQKPQFELSDNNAAAIAKICARLDGIPLALELAAARVKVLSAEQIATKLDDRFRLLTGGSRTALPRQQTLRALIDWSYALLEDPEKDLFRSLSVFRGGWTLETASTVSAKGDEDVFEVLDTLTHLVDKSLVAAIEQSTGEARYRMLETVRQYGRDRLIESGEVKALRVRHLECFLALAEEAEPKLLGPDQAIWLDRLESENDNLRAALDWSTAEGTDPELGLRLSGALEVFWLVRGYLSEGRAYLTDALQESSENSKGRAQALLWAGNLARDQGDYEIAKTSLDTALSVHKESGEERGVAATLSSLGNVASLQGRRELARSLYEESLEIRRRICDEPGIATSLNNLGILARRHGDFSQARSHLEESVAIRKRIGDRWGAAASLTNLGNVATTQEDYDTARTLYEDALRILRELGDKPYIAQTLHNLGEITFVGSDLTQTRIFYSESLSIRRELGDRAGIAESLDGFARLIAGKGNSEASIQLKSAATRIREEIGFQLPPEDQKREESQLESARNELSEEKFQWLRERGRGLSIESAAEFAIAWSAE